MWWKKNKWKVLVPVVVLAVLSIAFCFGGSSPGTHGAPIPAIVTGQDQYQVERPGSSTAEASEVKNDEAASEEAAAAAGNGQEPAQAQAQEPLQEGGSQGTGTAKP
ncbi:MAG: hypothetical protein IJG63_04645, partial [Oscillospiraceae bacterium]|nr:hypothetical protein [Oscillospiraceae bacterium]